MSLHDEIEKAIGAHGMWKTRLNDAIETGKSEFAPEKVCTDNQCEFGKWLYGATITAADKVGDHYEGIRKLHAEFHKITGDVLKLALEGKKAEAQKLVGTGGRFANLSAELTRAMMKWSDSVK
jgi:hypothetical protein